MLLKAQAISKSFGPVKVLTDSSLQVNEGDSIGLIGINGAGKSTFLKILLGELKYDTGELTRNTHNIGYLEQFPEASSEFTVKDVLGRQYGKYENINHRLAEIEGLMGSGKDVDWNTLATEYSDLERELERSDAKNEQKLIDSLTAVGLSKEIMSRTMDSLSGGERTKVMLSRILVQADDCDMIFMDEPTSHLDIETVEWLEDYLLESHCSLLVISHDRYFMDKIATRMTEISNGRTREYKGNYTDFITKKMLDLDRMEKEYKKYAAQKKAQEEIAEQLHKDQWYLTTHKTREKLISKMEEKEKPEENRDITVKIQAAPKSGKNVITCKGLSVELGGRTILENVDLDIIKGEKIGIYGSNGEGKSTLLKALMEKIPSKGELWVAPGAKIGYYSQNHEGLDLTLSAEEQILKIIGKERRGEARSLLSRMLLFGDDVDRPMKTLSGGQRARVAMCTLLLEETNVLVLDEPTNYLDIPARHAVEEALIEYDGTILTVTHDRYFLDSVCNKMIEVKDGNIRMFSGTYSEMRGRPNIKEVVMDADEYKVISPFTNWTTGRKYSKNDRALIAPADLSGFQWALDQGKLKKTGGRQRKKVNVPKESDR